MGKLDAGLHVFWAYIGFSQYMLIWYANIPEETEYFLRRNTESWWMLSTILVVGRFFVPVRLLLLRVDQETAASTLRAWPAGFCSCNARHVHRRSAGVASATACTSAFSISCRSSALARRSAFFFLRIVSEIFPLPRARSPFDRIAAPEQLIMTEEHIRNAFAAAAPGFRPGSVLFCSSSSSVFSFSSSSERCRAGAITNRNAPGHALEKLKTRSTRKPTRRSAVMVGSTRKRASPKFRSSAPWKLAVTELAAEETDRRWPDRHAAPPSRARCLGSPSAKPPTAPAGVADMRSNPTPEPVSVKVRDRKSQSSRWRDAIRTASLAPTRREPRRKTSCNLLSGEHPR